MKCKVDMENCLFNNEWTCKYAFIMPTFRNAAPVCLICRETVAVSREEYNLWRHHNTKHASFKESFLEQSEAHQGKMATLKSAYSLAGRIITQALTDQERVTCASLQAAWVLPKHNRPFTEAVVFKECMSPFWRNLPPTNPWTELLQLLNRHLCLLQLPHVVSTSWQRVSSNL